ncbi:MAG: M48 family metalloprotease [Deltaproteobacteria bacterium]|nr:M48 family metalloprotease [Deltaproteobacteria bacterium]
MKNTLSLWLLFSAAILMASCASAPPTASDDSVREVRKRQSQKVMEISKNDVEAEIQFGQELSARILGKYRLYDDKKATRYINLIGKGLASYSSRPEIDFRFAIINTDMINAFAAPGGYIFITKGTLKMIENEAQLAGVLAHEIAHVTERHIVKELDIKGRDTSVGAGFAAILGGGTSETVRAAFTQLVDKASELLFDKGLKREDELASDTLSVMLISNAGYNPVAYKKLLEKVESKKAKKEKEVLSATHPSIVDRVGAIEKLIAEEGLDALNYADVKKRYGKYIKL